MSDKNRKENNWQLLSWQRKFEGIAAGDTTSRMCPATSLG